MNSSKYTLDRFEGDYAIFLKRPEEIEQLQIHRQELGIELKEGDIVMIFEDGATYKIQLLEEETSVMKNNIQKIMERLKNRN